MLDLKKLKALELPRKEIEVEILGEKQTVEIQALDDETAIRITAIANSNEIGDDERELRARREILRGGIVGITGDQIDLLMKKGAAVVSEIMLKVRDLTTEYGQARNSAKDDAEKNSEPAAGAPVND